METGNRRSVTEIVNGILPSIEEKLDGITGTDEFSREIRYAVFVEALAAEGVIPYPAYDDTGEFAGFNFGTTEKKQTTTDDLTRRMRSTYEEPV